MFRTAARFSTQATGRRRCCQEGGSGRRLNRVKREMLTRQATASQVSWAVCGAELTVPGPLVAFKAMRDAYLQESLHEETGSKDSGEWLGGRGGLEELEEEEQLGDQESSPRGWGG